MNFADLGLGDDVLRAVEDAGYTEPTPIQAQAIPVVLMGRDVLGCAQTGTGKTAGFTLPMIEILGAGKAKARMPRSLILEPTRELAAQVAESFETYGKYHKLNKALLIGGHTMNQQIKTIDKGVDVLIATPGRLLDLFDRGHLLMHDVKILVIDEADRMLDMGFIPDVEKIVSMLPPIRNTLFFSATMPPEIRRLADAFLMNPKEISVDPPATTAETITQGVVMVKHGDGRRPGGGQKEKRDTLRQLIRQEKPNNALIFCNRKRDVDVVYKSLTRHGLEAFRLHGDMPQPVRTETLGKFKTGDIKLLVCSDVAARGLDIPDMSHVFNFDVPIHAEDYVHRIGRTGRAGKQGHTFMLATPEDGKYLSAIEKLIGGKIPLVTLGGQAKAELATPASSTPSAPVATDDKPRARQRGRGGRGRSRQGRSQETPQGNPKGTHKKASKPQSSSLPPSQAKPEVEKPQAKPETKKRPQRVANQKPQKGGDSQAQDAQPTKGLGEHMPAFLKPVPPKGG